jgi:CBS domain containing-hemolysin-like protein
MKISQLMQELQRQQLHMAVVKDEFGGTEGIITMEDIIEEIVGEIHDEYDDELKDIEQSADGSYLVNGRLAIGEFNSRFSSEIPEDAGYETVSGFLYKITGRIPDLNEEIPYGQMVFTIVRKSQRRIRMVKVRVRPAP